MSKLIAFADDPESRYGKLFPDDGEIPRPIPDPDLNYLVNEMTRIFETYITFTNDYHPFVCALWCAHTWLFASKGVLTGPPPKDPKKDSGSHHNLYYTGYLSFVAPSGGCGKTNALMLVSAMSYGNPTVEVGITAAGVFRTIKEGHTMVIDELDGVAEDPTLISVLNGGYKSRSQVTRMTGQTRDNPTQFQIFCPKAFGYVRDLDSLRKIKETLESRCIRIFLKKRSAAEEEAAEYLDWREVYDLTDLISAALMRWQYKIEPLPRKVSKMVWAKGLLGRENEIWEALFYVAHLCGRLGQAHAIAKRMVEENREDIQDNNPDKHVIRDIYNNLDEMCDDEGFKLDDAAQWLLRNDTRYYQRDKGWKINAKFLSTILAKYGLRPSKVGPNRLRRIPKEKVRDTLARYMTAEDDDGD